MGTVEVETAESVNHLEAMAQWAHLGRARAPFHLYVPAGCVDIARRLAAENAVNVAEIWSFHTIGDQTRFTLVHRAPTPEPRRTAEPAPLARPATKPAPKPAARPPAKSAAARTTRSSSAKAAGVKKRPAPEPRRKVAATATAKRRAPAGKARGQNRK
jgi:hypothetical protein